MKMHGYAISTLAAALIFSNIAVAGSLNVNYEVIGTGVDLGPQNGVYDEISELNLGSVNNNGWTSYRTEFEFNLRGIPPGAIVHSAYLNVTIGNCEGERSIEIHGFAGDGIVSLVDFARNGLVNAFPIAAPTSTPCVSIPLHLDVTPVITSTYEAGSTYVGFNVREEPANTNNYIVMNLEGIPILPTLNIEYTVERTIDIDIKPNSVPNIINSLSEGFIPVAILSDSLFDAISDIDSMSAITFGRSGDEQSLAFCNRNGKDVNGDGLLDLTCHFNTNATGFLIGDTQGVLKAKAKDGIDLKGTDSVRIKK